jgi:type VI secretion system protein ImpK
MTFQHTANSAGGGANDLAAVQFRDFVALLRQCVADGAALSEADGRGGAEAYSRKLCQLIELHSMAAGRDGGKAVADTEPQRRFLKAALADEVLLHCDWSGRAQWPHVLLETTLFHSSQAGQQVFADIDQLLREREPERRPLARLYLYLLSLGFQGRYRDGAAQGELANYRRELFQFVYQRAPELGAREAVLSEQPYASTLSMGAERRLPRPSRGVVALVLALFVLLGLSEVLWLWQSWPVRQALDAPVAPAIAQQPLQPSRGAPC